MVYKIISLFIVAGTIMAAELPAVTPETTIVSTTVVTVKEAVNYKPQLDALVKEISQLKNAQNALEKTNKELSARLEVQVKANEELVALTKKQDATFKLFGDKIVSFDKGIEGLKVKTDLLNDSFAALSKKLETQETALSSLKVSLDSFKVKLDIIQDDMKVGSDQVKALKDTIAINKGNVDSLISDNMEIKRQLKEINAKTSSKKEEGVMGWEYWGVVASGIGVLALIIAIVK